MDMVLSLSQPEKKVEKRNPLLKNMKIFYEKILAGMSVRRHIDVTRRCNISNRQEGDLLAF